MKKIIFRLLGILAALVIIAVLYLGYRYLNLPSVTGDEASWSPDGTSLVFTSERDADRDLFEFDLADGRIQKIFDSDSADYYPVWSPDMRRLAYNSKRDGDWYLCIFEIGIRPPECLFATETFNPMRPVWLGDGSAIIIPANRSGNSELYLVPMDGSAASPLAEISGAETFPTLSADGSRLVFVGDANGCRQLFELDMNSKSVRAITAENVDASQPSVNPVDGSLAYIIRLDGGPQLFVLSGDGDARQVTHTGRNFAPQWSPDGNRLAFTSDRDGDLAIFMLDVESEAITRLTPRVD